MAVQRQLECTPPGFLPALRVERIAREHVHTPIHIPVTSERFVIKFGVLLEKHYLTMRFTQVIGGQYLHERKYTCTPSYAAHLFAPARSSPKRRITSVYVLLVTL